MTKHSRAASYLLVAIAIWGICITSLVAVLFYPNAHDPDERAIMSMGISLIIIWCIMGGIAMRTWREQIVGWMCRIRLGWRVRFVLLCILMAMLEEAVTTSLTNAAPLFGGVTDAARITASQNYFEVICYHSVVAFIPMFICWAWLQSRYAFSPVEVFLLFGLNGTLAETLTFGLDNLTGVGMWTYVYGLMVYLPAHTVPQSQDRIAVRWYHWLLAVALPMFFIIPFMLYLAYRLMIWICRSLYGLFHRI